MIKIHRLSTERARDVRMMLNDHIGAIKSKYNELCTTAMEGQRDSASNDNIKSGPAVRDLERSLRDSGLSRKQAMTAISKTKELLPLSDSVDESPLERSDTTQCDTGKELDPVVSDLLKRCEDFF